MHGLNAGPVRKAHPARQVIFVDWIEAKVVIHGVSYFPTALPTQLVIPVWNLRSSQIEGMYWLCADGRKRLLKGAEPLPL